MQNETDKAASRFLGKRVSGSDIYNPELLVSVPRAENRKQYNIDNTNLPFVGCDVWHAYEFSSMTESGLPVTRVMKIKYNCNNDFIIESKSLKLYLNSFNMSRFGQTVDECLSICKDLITKDLSDKLQTQVYVNFINENSKKIEIFKQFQNIMNNIDQTSLKIDRFKEAPELLKVESTSDEQEYYLMFDSLRSNCRVTHQPDFGTAFIFYKSKKHILEHSLVQYLTSFRSEYHFHEECCEMIFKRLQDILNDNDELFVCALYTRRGGIDISPIRYTLNCQEKDSKILSDINILARGCINQ